jgi:hypothetical protein
LGFLLVLLVLLVLLHLLKGRFEELATEDVGIVFMCCFLFLFICI